MLPIPVRPSSPTILFALLGTTLACSSPMPSRHDAGQDASGLEVARDLPAVTPELGPDLPAGAPDFAQDLPGRTPDLGPGDAGGGGDERQLGGVPKRFRFDNHTDQTVYITNASPVSCAQQEPSGLVEDCSFFRLACGMSCSAVTSPQSCCNLCIAETPGLYAIAPGESQSVAWAGTIHAKVTGICDDCWCDGESAVSAHLLYQASIAVYTDRTCPDNCPVTDAGVIDRASPAGSPTTYTVAFAIPYLGDEIVFDIGGRSGLDAASLDFEKSSEAAAELPPVGPDASGVLATDVLPSLDSPWGEDLPLDGFPAVFAGLLGATFAIDSQATPPDASVASGNACSPPDPPAHYDLTFSPSGAQVQIARTTSVEEPMSTGTLTIAANEHLVYQVANTFAGGQLEIWMTDGVPTAQLVLYGSGVPVLWCIQSPMSRVNLGVAS